MKPDRRTTNGTSHKVLNAPVHLGSMAANLETEVEDIKSIWVMQRDDMLVSGYSVLYGSQFNSLKDIPGDISLKVLQNSCCFLCGSFLFNF